MPAPIEHAALVGVSITEWRRGFPRISPMTPPAALVGVSITEWRQAGVGEKLRHSRRSRWCQHYRMAAPVGISPLHRPLAALVGVSITEWRAQNAALESNVDYCRSRWCQHYRMAALARRVRAVLRHRRSRWCQHYRKAEDSSQLAEWKAKSRSRWCQHYRMAEGACSGRERPY